MLLIVFALFWAERVAIVTLEQCEVFLQLSFALGVLFELDELICHTSNAPDVNRRTILLFNSDDFWRSIPSRLDVGRHISFTLVLSPLRERPRKTEVTDLNLAEFVDQDVCWLQVSVNNIC